MRGGGGLSPVVFGTEFVVICTLENVNIGKQIGI